MRREAARRVCFESAARDTVLRGSRLRTRDTARETRGRRRKSKVGAVGLIAASKTLFSVSEAVTLYATLLAPVALVLLVNSFQPLFVFAFGAVLTLLFPNVAKESLGRVKMLQKGVGICLMLIGGFLISG